MTDAHASTKILKHHKHTLLQTGGEGAIFAHDQKAFKIYHNPTSARAKKLQTFLSRRFSQRLPANVLGPQRLITGEHGRIVGFEMRLLPETTQPWKKLSQPNFCQQHGLDLSQELDLLLAIHRNLQQIHAAGLIVGDLNDHNIFVDLQNCQAGSTQQADGVYWIDVDSYQFERFPCPVALDAFLDPRLYGVADFSIGPVFSQESDWYAFAVLLYKTLLKTHPYGGTHPQLKTLRTRAVQRVSVLHPSVTYPKAARPATVVDQALLAYLHEVFEEDSRGPLPAAMLENLRQSLTHCSRCNKAYAASRPHCPFCRQHLPRVKPASVSGALQVQPLLQTTGVISCLFVRPSGRMIAITRHGQQYRLVHLGVGGILSETPLFSGQSGARFALFQDVLMVNRRAQRDLLLIDIGGSRLRQIITLDSERFRGEAVFAASPHALYRLANGYVLRGQMRRRNFLEDIVTTAHRRRTQLWASPYSDHVAGFHHRFAGHQLFILDDHHCEHIFSPSSFESTRGTISAMDVAWGPQTVAFLWHESGNRSPIFHVQVHDFGGNLRHQAQQPASSPPFDRLDGKLVNGRTLLNPTDGGILKIHPHTQALLGDLAAYPSANATLHWHPRGVLIQSASSLFLAEET